MDDNFEQLILAFDISGVSNDVLQQITILIQKQTNETLSSFISENYQSLTDLEHKIWQLLSLYPSEWLNQSYCLEFLQTIAIFNKKIVFNEDDTKDDTKVSLLIPETNVQIDKILEQIKQCDDANDPFITITSLWFENLAFCVHEYPRFGHLPIIIHLNQSIGQNFLMNEQYKLYLTELEQSEISSSIFTAKQLFYMKTCSLTLDAYFFSSPQTFAYTSQEILSHIGENYFRTIEIQSYSVEYWSKELLACISSLTAFIRAYLWWDGEKGTKFKEFLPKEKVLCDFIQSLIRIIDYKPFYQLIKSQRMNDETILFDSILLCLMNFLQTLNIHWFFRSIPHLSDIFFTLAQSPNYYYCITLCSYGVLSEILSDEAIKRLKVGDGMRVFFFNMFEEAWRNPEKKYKQIPLMYLLKGFLNISKGDLIQQGTAKSNKISIIIEISEQYPIALDIIWALSFNQDIQQQLRSNSMFMSKLAHSQKDCDNEYIRKTIQGILWNLEINHEDRQTTAIEDTKSFDIMISYSHKEKTLCQQIYDELTKAGHRVWIDFDQMHGNVMDAMAQAIEQSHTVIICMSEAYRKSSYCRAEAHYAFQRQRKIVPVLLQKHYKPDGWLLFLIGQLLYVDFNKHEFARAMAMLFKELKVRDSHENNVTPVPPKEDNDITLPTISVISSPRASAALTVSNHIVDWTQTQVQDWLGGHNLNQMCQLFSNCDGRGLVYISRYMKTCEPQQVLNLLQEDCRRRTNESISLIELSCFQSLIDQEKKLSKSNTTTRNTDKKDNQIFY